MKKVREAQFSLKDIVEEASQFAYQSRQLHDAIVKDYEEHAKKIRQFKAEYSALMAKAKKEINQGKNALTMIEGHYTWKETVRKLFGEEGLQRCFDEMSKK